MASVRINDTITIESSSEDTILETMEKAGLEPEYHCRDGHCGACRCKLKAGQVEYVAFAMAYTAEDEVLPCISKAKTPVELSGVHYQVKAKRA